MIIQMAKNQFDSLDIGALGHACFEPIVPIYQQAMKGRGDKSQQEVRTEFYQSLSHGQRALFMFFSYYDHAIRSLEEFVRISHHYLSAQIFGAVKRGAEFFHDDNMLYLLFEIEQAIAESKHSLLPQLYNRLQEIAPKTLEIIGISIKENPTEFICFE